MVKDKKVTLVVAVVVLMIAVMMWGVMFLNGTSASSSEIENGLYAYGLTTQSGYDGTVREWLALLADKSAYEIAVENGYSGSEEEWNNEVEDAAENPVSVKAAEFSKRGEMLVTLSNDSVLNLGVAAEFSATDGVTNASISEDGQLEVSYADGKAVKLGNAYGEAQNVDNGLSMQTIDMSSEGNLKIALTNQNTMDLGCIKEAGAEEVGVSGASIDENENVLITLSDDSVINVSDVVGEAKTEMKTVAVSKEGILTVTLGNDTKRILGSIKYRVGIDGKAPSFRENVVLTEDGTKSGEDTDSIIKAYINGVDGMNVVNAYINENMEMILEMSNGQLINAGNTGSGGVAAAMFTVTFKDYDGTVLKTETVERGKSATAPTSPTRDGYVFIGWDVAFDKISSDLTVIAQYEESTTPVIYVAKVSAENGDKSIQVPVSIANNPGIMGMVLTVTYDESVMTLKGGTAGSALSGLEMTAPGKLGSGCKFGWDGMQEVTGNGEMLILTFDIKDSAAAGIHDIQISCGTGDIFDGDYNDLSFEMKKGTITIRTKISSQSIYGATVTASAGQTSIQVPISITDNPGIIGMVLKISYDESVMTLKSGTAGAALSGLAMTAPGNLGSGCKFGWDGTDAVASDGEILILTFDINDTAAAGTYDIQIAYTQGDIFDGDYNDLTFELQKGSIIIQ
ncbi:MAG: InlB B-repeat-containing protein [Roseburia sp.]|nr:InlB B-repeat-containing protein [Roseburia sp.]